MKNLLRTLMVLTLLRPLGAQQAAPQADPVAIVTKAARSYKALTSLQAEFRMRVEDPQLGNEESRGMLAQAGKNRFAMRWTTPAGQFYLIDGKDEYKYFPSITRDQVHQNPAPVTSIYGLNYVDWFFDNPVERYELKYVGSETVNGRATDAVLMTPHTRNEIFSRATVWFDREDGIPRRIELYRPPGRQIIDLTKVQKNQLIADSIFKFSMPAGAHIVSPGH